MRKMIIKPVIIGLLLSSLLTRANAQDDIQLRVTIIAVTQFDDADLRNDSKVLVEGINKATNDLDIFFRTQYHVAPRIFTLRDDTTGGALRNWLFHDLPLESGQNINLIFFLTHGIGYQYSGSTRFKNEVFLVTSDTRSDSFFRDAIRGSELVDSFERLSRGSSVFLFLDTCGSGAIDNGGILAALGANSEDATRMMILAASMADENSYRARFTESLLDIWKSNAVPAADGCHYGERGIQSFVNSVMDHNYPLPNGLTQDVSLVFPFTNDFCIESFFASSSLALLDNSTDEPVKVTVRLASDPQHSLSPVTVKAHQVEPISLRREVYDLNIEPEMGSSSIRNSSLKLDLTTQYVQHVQLEPSLLLDAAAGAQRSAIVAAEFGAPTPIIEDLRQSATVALQQARDAAQQTLLQQQVSVHSQQAEIEEASSRINAAEHHLQQINAQVSAEASPPATAGGRNMNGLSDLAGISPLERDREQNSREQGAERASAELSATKLQLEVDKAGLEKTRSQVAMAEVEISRVSKIANDDLASRASLGEQAKARASLLGALSNLFPMRESTRGLIMSVPADASAAKLSEAGKMISSAGADAIVEVECYVSGSDELSDQRRAMAAAEFIRGGLLRGTPLLPERVVPRGFAGVQKPKGSPIVQEVIVSGDLIHEVTSISR